jgi:two-component system, OmpR family, response regulator
MRVLVVEDEKLIACDIADALDQAGYLAELAHDGEDAWFRAEAEEFDAIILDLGLPRLDGLSVVRKLRAAEISTPILILTARGAWMERVEGIDAGADDYLTKPFHTEELVARLGALVRRTSGHLTPTLESGAISLDTRRKIALVEGRNIALSALEYRVLRYLLHHQSRVVPQGELIDHVYGDDREMDCNAMEALILRLRRKVVRSASPQSAAMVTSSGRLRDGWFSSAPLARPDSCVHRHHAACGGRGAGPCFRKPYPQARRAGA